MDVSDTLPAEIQWATVDQVSTRETEAAARRKTQQKEGIASKPAKVSGTGCGLL